MICEGARKGTCDMYLNISSSEQNSLWSGGFSLVRLQLLSSLHLHGAVNDPVRSHRLQTLNLHDHNLKTPTEGSNRMMCSVWTVKEKTPETNKLPVFVWPITPPEWTTAPRQTWTGCLPRLPCPGRSCSWRSVWASVWSPDLLWTPADSPGSPWAGWPTNAAPPQKEAPSLQRRTSGISSPAGRTHRHAVKTTACINVRASQCRMMYVQSFHIHCLKHSCSWSSLRI